MCAAAAFTSQDSVDGRVCGEARLAPLMEDSRVGQILGQEEAPAGEHRRVTHSSKST